MARPKQPSRRILAGQGDIKTTSVSLPARTLNLLKIVALSRQQRAGGRDSVSKVITDLIEENRRRFEAEVKDFRLSS